MMFDFKPSKRLAKEFARRSALVLDMSRTVDHGMPGVLVFSGKPDPRKMRGVIGDTVAGVFVCLASEADTETGDVRYPLTYGKRRFRDKPHAELLIHLHLLDTKRTRKLVDALCGEFVGWLRQKGGTVAMPQRHPAARFVMEAGSAVMVVRARMAPSDWSRTPVTTVFEPPKLR